MIHCLCPEGPRPSERLPKFLLIEDFGRRWIRINSTTTTTHLVTHTCEDLLPSCASITYEITITSRGPEEKNLLYCLLCPCSWRGYMRRRLKSRVGAYSASFWVLWLQFPLSPTPPTSQLHQRSTLTPRCSVPRNPQGGRQCPDPVWGNDSERPAVERRRGRWEGDQGLHPWQKASLAGPGFGICIQTVKCMSNMHQPIPFSLKCSERAHLGPRLVLPSLVDVYIYILNNLTRIIKLCAEALDSPLISSKPISYHTQPDLSQNGGHLFFPMGLRDGFVEHARPAHPRSQIAGSEGCWLQVHRAGHGRFH